MPVHDAPADSAPPISPEALARLEIVAAQFREIYGAEAEEEREERRLRPLLAQVPQEFWGEF